MIVDLKEILANHKKWLRSEEGGIRADLTGLDLTGADLTGVDLTDADLAGASLFNADLHGADLTGADLHCADLTGADLHDAGLSYTNLSYANLTSADLSDADLSHADLSNADLSDVNLLGVNLHCAYLSSAKIKIELLNKFFPICCPEYGAFIGWKKCLNNIIVKLEICEDAKRSSAYGRKCRCSKAKVLALENLDGTPSAEKVAFSSHDKNFVYFVGDVVSVDDFDEDRRNECSTGIHFFITRQEAVDY